MGLGKRCLCLSLPPGTLVRRHCERGGVLEVRVLVVASGSSGPHFRVHSVAWLVRQLVRVHAGLCSRGVRQSGSTFQGAMAFRVQFQGATCQVQGPACRWAPALGAGRCMKKGPRVQGSRAAPTGSLGRQSTLRSVVCLCLPACACQPAR